MPTGVIVRKLSLSDHRSPSWFERATSPGPLLVRGCQKLCPREQSPRDLKPRLKAQPLARPASMLFSFLCLHSAEMEEKRPGGGQGR